MNNKIKILLWASLASASFGGSTKIVPKSPITPIIEETSFFDISYYAGARIGTTELFDDKSEEKFSSKSYAFLLGMNINEYLGIEGRYYKSFSEMEYDKGVTQNRDSADFPATLSAYSVLMKARYSVGDFTPYLLLGYGQIQLDAIPLSPAGKAKRTGSSLQYGIGASYSFFKDLEVAVEYISLYNKRGFDGRAKTSNVTNDTILFGINYNF